MYSAINQKPSPDVLTLTERSRWRRNWPIKL